jgi:hypothetical protein
MKKFNMFYLVAWILVIFLGNVTAMCFADYSESSYLTGFMVGTFSFLLLLFGKND